MKKVLYILQGLETGGVANVLLNYYREIKSFCSADFIVKKSTNMQCANVMELRSYGCNIYPVTSFNKDMFQYSKEVKDIIIKGNYDVVHDNNKYFGFLSLVHAKKAGVPIRISHVHNTVASTEKNLPHRLFIEFSSRLTMRYATCLMACSEQAGKSMFADMKFHVLNNAIDVSKYRFDASLREQYRKVLGLEGKFVVITVGRYDELKRYDFAMSVFSELHKMMKNAIYIVVGATIDNLSGADLRMYQSLDEETKSSILFLGTREDAHLLLNCADTFLLSSQHEGFGIAVIEAQASGLPCFVSTGLPRSVKVSNLVSFYELTDSSKLWAEAISKANGFSKREEYATAVQDSDYSIKKCTIGLLNVYGVSEGMSGEINICN